MAEPDTGEDAAADCTNLRQIPDSALLLLWGLPLAAWRDTEVQLKRLQQLAASCRACLPCDTSYYCCSAETTTHLLHRSLHQAALRQTETRLGRTQQLTASCWARVAPRRPCRRTRSCQQTSSQPA